MQSHRITADRIQLGDEITVDRIRCTVVRVGSAVAYPRNRAESTRSLVTVNARPHNRNRRMREVTFELTDKVTVRRAPAFEVIDG